MRAAKSAKIINQTPKYKQILYYQYPSWHLASLSSEICRYYHLPFIFKNIKSLKKRQKYAKTSHESLQATIRIGTMLMYEAYHRQPKQADEYIHHYIQTDVPIDYKYSELFKEGSLIQMVTIYREHTSDGLDWALASIEYLLKENVNLFNRLDRIAKIVGINRQKPRTKLQYFRQSKEKEDINKNLPFRTFAFMNRNIDLKELTSTSQKSRKYLFGRDYEDRLDADAAQNAEQLASILKRELPKIDYLIAIEFMLTYLKSQRNIDEITEYMVEDISTPQKSTKSHQRAIQVILLARISKHLIDMFPESSKYITFQVEYIQHYVTILQNMKDIELIELLGRRDQIFQKYLLVQLPPYVHSKLIKQQYLRILALILDHSKYGELLYPEQSMNGLFQSLLILCGEEDRQAIIQILSSYEYYQLFHPNQNAPAIDACLLAFRYNFRSNVLSEQLASSLDLNYLSLDLSDIYTRKMLENNLKVAFDHYICLELKEENLQNDTSQIVTRMVDIFETLDLKRYKLKAKNHSNNENMSYIRKLAFQPIASVEKWLRIANKISQITRKTRNQSLSLRLSNILNKLLNDSAYRHELLDFIAYPNLYELLLNILHHEKSQVCQNFLKQLKENVKRYEKLHSDQQWKRVMPYFHPIFYQSFAGCLLFHSPNVPSYHQLYSRHYLKVNNSIKQLIKDETINKETISSALLQHSKGSKVSEQSKSQQTNAKTQEPRFSAESNTKTQTKQEEATSISKKHTVKEFLRVRRKMSTQEQEKQQTSKDEQEIKEKKKQSAQKAKEQQTIKYSEKRTRLKRSKTEQPKRTHLSFFQKPTESQKEEKKTAENKKVQKKQPAEPTKKYPFKKTEKKKESQSPQKPQQSQTKTSKTFFKSRVSTKPVKSVSALLSRPLRRSNVKFFPVK